MRKSLWMIAIISLFVISVAPQPTQAVDKDRFEPLRRFSQVLDLVEHNYVKDISRKELVDDAVKGMLEQLDPHSTFLSTNDFKEMQESTSGEFSGIGIEISMEKGRLTVISPIEDTPAYKAGLKPGDLILEIDGDSTQSISLMEAVGKIRGKRGTDVILTILHKDANKPKKVTITRGSIQIKSVKNQELEDGYLYLRLTRFNENTTREMHSALKKYKKSHTLKGIVLDLRNNPGGLLTQAVSVADTFIDEGLIVYIEGRNKAGRVNYNAKEKANDVVVPIVTLINAGSASASEIVAGALKDHDRALLVGERSFGKGSVQTIIPMPDGSGIKLTTALYYTPSGRSIQAEGIEPDIIYPFVPPKVDNEKDDSFIVREKDLNRHLENSGDGKKSKKKQDEKAKKMLERDNQIRLSLQLVKQLPRLKEIK
ncbi:S41 family peptidase [Maridesulfovibrio hydrothermalis]|uniref:Carboxy-terminal-processing protease n=1 Tax=Maridesulfovibrio hydrothermalis AM13 = DSM 14728 TaxID=1121451 RepID=L0RBZ5_9BACT|nr:S41 family peptidase [Maridesulfovibrio hydrothermalis]CCO24303.1 Carboxy-terminal-processing protease [Maridesulfovibrio hydrothermalis AM13 = DSM 14728]